MPIFEYKCRKCGHTMEFLDKNARARKHLCKACNSSDLQRLFSSFSVGQASDSSPRGNDDSCPTGTCPLS